ncbi:MAG: DNA-binding protein [Flavobacteriales bacterium]
MIIKFEELRHIKDSLPTGSMQVIADELNLNVATVRNYFGGSNFKDGDIQQIHFEKGVNGGFVKLEDTRIFDAAIRLLEKEVEAAY